MSGQQQSEMHCPGCGHQGSYVVDSRGADPFIRRRRECCACKTRFTTYEFYSPYPVPKPGSRGHEDVVLLMLPKSQVRSIRHSMKKVLRTLQMVGDSHAETQAHSDKPTP